MTPTGSLITLRCIPSGPISSVCPVHFSASLVCLLLQVMIHFLRLCYKVTGPRRPGSRLNKKKKPVQRRHWGLFHILCLWVSFPLWAVGPHFPWVSFWWPCTYRSPSCYPSHPLLVSALLIWSLFIKLFIPFALVVCFWSMFRTGSWVRWNFLYHQDTPKS